VSPADSGSPRAAHSQERLRVPSSVPEPGPPGPPVPVQLERGPQAERIPPNGRQVLPDSALLKRVSDQPVLPDSALLKRVSDQLVLPDSARLVAQPKVPRAW
jgi:hypothetical protein